MFKPSDKCIAAGDHFLVSALLRDQVSDLLPVNSRICKADEMLSYLLSLEGADRDTALAAYFETGIGIFQALRQIVGWRFGGFSGIGRLLDFASGYGRVTRFFVRAMDPSRISVSDIDRDAIEFQAREFGVNVFPSALGPEDLSAPETFDCIFVTSLFTHLPERTFGPWLYRLLDLLKPGGLLVFTVHDQARIGRGGQAGENGISFYRTSESRRLRTHDYGTTYVTEAYVGQLLAAFRDPCSWRRIAGGVLNHQDLFLVTNKPGADFAALRFARPPVGFFDGCQLVPDGRLQSYGWSCDLSEGAPVERVEISLGGKRMAQTDFFGPRPDVAQHFGDERYRMSGWSCEFSLPPDASRDNDALLIKAVSRGGAEKILFAGTITSARQRSLRAEQLLKKQRRPIWKIYASWRKFRGALSQWRVRHFPRG